MVIKRGMAKRGEQLREHILFAAKDVFLEVGFERASMDTVSARAQTSKRTLYAHFENKEKLYLAVVEFSRGLFLGRVKKPGDYTGSTEEVLVQFGGRFLEILLYGPVVRMCRMAMAEADRFPEGSAQLFDALFFEVQERLSAYLQEALGLSAKESQSRAQELLGRILYPRFTRALFGVDELNGQLGDDTHSDFDLEAVRKIVVQFLKTL